MQRSSRWCRDCISVFLVGRDRKRSEPRSLYIHAFLHVATRTRYGALLLPAKSVKKRENMRISYTNLLHSPFSFMPHDWVPLFVLRPQPYDPNLRTILSCADSQRHSLPHLEQPFQDLRINTQVRFLSCTALSPLSLAISLTLVCLVESSPRVRYERTVNGGRGSTASRAQGCAQA